jgi:membrane protein insertase Oxa1/YidC/SpoIIIJ
MKTTYAKLLSAIAVATLMAGCASPMMDHSSDSMGTMSKSNGDMTALCDMHKKMMTMSPQDQKMMMDEHMKGMSPELRAEHMAAMKKCM